MTVGKLLNSLQHRLEQGRRLQRAVLQDVIEAVRAEKLPLGIAGLGDAVGVEDDLVTRLKLLHVLLVGFLRSEPERKAVHAIQGEQRAVLTAFNTRWVVAGTGIGDG